jgi:hypothetical protein
MQMNCLHRKWFEPKLLQSIVQSLTQQRRFHYGYGHEALHTAQSSSLAHGGGVAIALVHALNGLAEGFDDFQIFNDAVHAGTIDQKTRLVKNNLRAMHEKKIKKNLHNQRNSC